MENLVWKQRIDCKPFSLSVNACIQLWLYVCNLLIYKELAYIYTTRIILLVELRFGEYLEWQLLRVT